MVSVSHLIGQSESVWRSVEAPSQTNRHKRRKRWAQRLTCLRAEGESSAHILYVYRLKRRLDYRYATGGTVSDWLTSSHVTPHCVSVESKRWSFHSIRAFVSVNSDLSLVSTFCRFLSSIVTDSHPIAKPRCPPPDREPGTHPTVTTLGGHRPSSLVSVLASAAFNERQRRSNASALECRSSDNTAIVCSAEYLWYTALVSLIGY